MGEVEDPECGWQPCIRGGLAEAQAQGDPWHEAAGGGGKERRNQFMVDGMRSLNLQEKN